jgi:hypothetical protein
MASDAFEHEVVDYLRKTHAAAFELSLWTRGVVLEAEASFVERVYPGWRGVGFRHPVAGYVCALYPQSHGDVRLLFEHGATLPDPDRLLRGNGRQTRYLPVAAADERTADAIRALVQRAVAERLPLS